MRVAWATENFWLIDIKGVLEGRGGNNTPGPGCLGVSGGKAREAFLSKGVGAA